jgi:hypothetical protein
MQPVTLTEQERRDLLALLKTSGDSVNAAVAGLTDAQWRFLPSPASWAVADIVEHLAKSERAVQSLVTQVLVKQPVVALSHRTRVKDMAIVLAVHNRDVKFQAAELVRPEQAWETTAGLIGQFQGLRTGTLEYVGQTADDLRGRLADHPVIGVIDAYQWLLFLGAHTDRHVAQLKEVTADPRFPRR